MRLLGHLAVKCCGCRMSRPPAEGSLGFGSISTSTSAPRGLFKQQSPGRASHGATALSRTAGPDRGAR